MQSFHSYVQNLFEVRNNSKKLLNKFLSDDNLFPIVGEPEDDIYDRISAPRYKIVKSPSLNDTDKEITRIMYDQNYSTKQISTALAHKHNKNDNLSYVGSIESYLNRRFVNMTMPEDEKKIIKDMLEQGKNANEVALELRKYPAWFIEDFARRNNISITDNSESWKTKNQQWDDEDAQAASSGSFNKWNNDDASELMRKRRQWDNPTIPDPDEDADIRQNYEDSERKKNLRAWEKENQAKKWGPERPVSMPTPPSDREESDSILDKTIGGISNVQLGKKKIPLNPHAINNDPTYQQLFARFNKWQSPQFISMEMGIPIRHVYQILSAWMRQDGMTNQEIAELLNIPMKGAWEKLIDPS